MASSRQAEPLRRTVGSDWARTDVDAYLTPDLGNLERDMPGVLPCHVVGDEHRQLPESADMRLSYATLLAMDESADRLRELCLALPEVTERLSHGEPAWFAGGNKLFVTYADHHHDDRLAFWCAAPAGAQAAFVANHPDRYFRPPYVGHRGWLGVYLDVPVDWDDVAEHVTDAYRIVAPKRLVAVLAGPPQPDDPSR